MSDTMAKAPRVLMAADVSAAADTGLGRHQWYLARELERHGFAVRELYSETVDAGISQPVRRFRFPWAVLQEVRGEARRGAPYDIALVHEGSAGPLCLARRQGLLPTVCVAVSHNPEQKVWEYSLEYARRGMQRISWKSRVLWPATRLWQSNLALRLADQVLCLSEEDVSFITQRFSRASGGIGRIANGIQPDCFLEPRPKGPAKILFLGSWIPLKGITELRAALAGALVRHGDASVSLVGVGLPEEDVLRTLPAAVQPRVSVRSHFSSSELPGILAAHNIFVLPSWWEGMPIALLEAMGAGLAPVVTSVGGMRDVLRQGVDGLCVPPNDPGALAAALFRVCEDQDLRTKLGAAARARAELYTWGRAGERLAGLLRSLLHPVGGPASDPDWQQA